MKVRRSALSSAARAAPRSVPGNEHDDGTVQVRLTGRLDRRDNGIKALPFLVGRIGEIDITLLRR
ncbi:MAG: hypothetical protein H0V67_00715 [Geodermatophilaceae bacterium]|nr:hypothetical protein [Geodermatophilaceae bacterium]